MAIPQSVRDLLASGPLVHLTTINPDGSPQVTVVWMAVEGDELVTAHMPHNQKVRNAERDGRVVASMLGPTTNAMGLREYLVVYGTARVTEGGAAALLQQMAHTYIGPDAEFPPEVVRHLPGYVIRITPERYSGVGPWTAE